MSGQVLDGIKKPFFALNDNEEVGFCKCDKHDEPSCLLKFFCAPCVTCNWMGCSIFTFVLFWLVGGIFFCITNLLLVFGVIEVPIMGRDYPSCSKNKGVVGGPIMAQQGYGTNQ
jgi:hypothetical protein